MPGLSVFQGAASLEDTSPHMVMEIKKASISWWLHVEYGAHFALASEGNAVESCPIRVGPPTRVFMEILADAGCGSQALAPELSRERQSRDAIALVGDSVDVDWDQTEEVIRGSVHRQTRQPLSGTVRHFKYNARSAGNPEPCCRLPALPEPRALEKLTNLY